MNNIKVIGITGAAGSGKDTFALMLRTFLKTDTSWTVDSFAAPIKKMLAVGLGLHEPSTRKEKEAMTVYGKTYRNMMQTLGTEWGRDLVAQDIWRVAMEQRCAYRNVIIPDVRFEDEAEWVRERGILLHMKRPDQEHIQENLHVSEGGVNVDPFGDIVIYNLGDLEDLKDQAKYLAPGPLFDPIR